MFRFYNQEDIFKQMSNNVFVWTAYDAIFNLKVIQLFKFFSFSGSQVFVLQGLCSVHEFISSFLALHLTVQSSCEFFILVSIILHLSCMVNELECSIVSLISNLLSHLHSYVLVVCVKQVSLWSLWKFPIS